MSAERLLARDFVEAHPADAARVLEGLPAGELESFFREIPVSLAAACIRSLAPAKSAELLAGTPIERGGQIVCALHTWDAAAALRPIPPERQDSLLAATPEEVSKPVRRLLEHPEGTAGSLMDSRVPPFPGDMSVADARALLRRSAPHAMYYVYVVDREGYLIGALNMRLLMSTASKGPLESLMRRPVSSLPSPADRAAILAHPAWRDLHALPVVDPSGRYLGVLRYETLKRLEAENPAERRYERALSAALAFGELYWVGWSRVVGAVTSMALAEDRQSARRREVDHGHDV